MLKFAVLSLAMVVCSARSYGGDHHSIELPVHSKSDTEIIHTESHEDEQETSVDIPGGVLPVYINFKTQSSPIYVKQQHKNRGGSHQSSHSEDETHHLVHEVVKPVVQELREIITPYRKVVQVIEPVREEVLTKVHKGDRRSHKDDY